MKTKHLAILLMLAVVFISCQNKTVTNDTDHSGTTPEDANLNAEQTAAVNHYNIDLENSKASWKGSMMGAYAHEGDIDFSEGNIEISNGIVTGGAFKVDMNSIVTTDDDGLYKLAPREKLVQHLQADDFFAADKYPTSSFKIKSMNGDEIKGDLTIRGNTHEETVKNVSITEENGSFTATGNLTFDRKKYDVAYENKMSDLVLSKDIELKIALTGNMQ